MGVLMENSSSPLFFLHRNLITPLLLSADKSIISLSQKSKLLELIRHVIVSVFFVLLNLVCSLPLPFPFCFEGGSGENNKFDNKQLVHSQVSNGRASTTDTAIARAMNQLLMLVNHVPVSSRKYELVTCLAEKLIEDNLTDGSDVLREVNCVVLSEAFGRALCGLESELLGFDQGDSSGFGLGRVVSMVKGWGGLKESAGGPSRVDMVFAEKTAAELLWLAQKMEASGGVEVVVEKWAWASNLGWLALSCESRVQASLVKLTAFLIKQANQMCKRQQTNGEEWERQKHTMVKMLITWIPLLCQANNGTDSPTLSVSERREVEKALEEIIEMLEDDEGSQEKVLSVWLHHFTHCPSSDWPNLYNSYVKWCTISRKLIVSPC
ncbi:uncharacterized protein LOC141648341 [Silene latifolia]|uniref:uncharacterized protein LOC141648341 n=1 Tax=Silene latifolia TaxID=37657 RepID=UPI003D771D83